MQQINVLFQVCGSMPYDDSNIKKMIKNQTERRVHFSRSKNVNTQCKELVWAMLEANIGQRYNIRQVMNHAWLNEARRKAEEEQAAAVASQVPISPVVQDDEMSRVAEVSVRT